MTFSIIAVDPKTGDLGIAVSSKILAVGSFVPHAEANVGAVATQSFANLNYAYEGLDLMKQGYTPEQIIQYITSKDPEKDIRQVAMINANGQIDTYTGQQCVAWAGHYIREGYSVQGNMLTNQTVIIKMAEEFERSRQIRLSFPEQLMRALEAGESAGGDKRGKQSAAILVVRNKAGYGGYNDRYIDLRVDNSSNPLQDLRTALEYKLIHQW